MNTIQDPVISLPLDRLVEVGRFVFAALGGAYGFTLEPTRDGFEIVAEWCKHEEREPCDGGHAFFGGRSLVSHCP